MESHRHQSHFIVPLNINPPPWPQLLRFAINSRRMIWKIPCSYSRVALVSWGRRIFWSPFYIYMCIPYDIWKSFINFSAFFDVHWVVYLIRYEFDMNLAHNSTIEDELQVNSHDFQPLPTTFDHFSHLTEEELNCFALMSIEHEAFDCFHSDKIKSIFFRGLQRREALRQLPLWPPSWFDAPNSIAVWYWNCSCTSDGIIIYFFMVSIEKLITTSSYRHAACISLKRTLKNFDDFVLYLRQSSPNDSSSTL